MTDTEEGSVSVRLPQGQRVCGANLSIWDEPQFVPAAPVLFPENI